MKTKTDLYTKIVLTVIAIALTTNLIKDIGFVSKAQAGEVVNLNAEKAAEEDITFFIYENSKIKQPFSSRYYDECIIDYKDIPTHIITTKKIEYPDPFSNNHLRINKIEKK
ncbi:hypothetical protein D0T84_21795 [Dysgonomonas sp. 521]|uniref:hypothetical protein n=1 Tax=Dysgonomonas sp. 521 TaxID=2302932 RepID=UPI0013D400F6|nr:hypothetical protein [Dysgonomonas sp. 521]NDV97504.1 hypothetical protein [Dysgonomonas sp. 521]